HGPIDRPAFLFAFPQAEGVSPPPAGMVAPGRLRPTEHLPPPLALRLLDDAPAFSWSRADKQAGGPVGGVAGPDGPGDLPLFRRGGRLVPAQLRRPGAQLLVRERCHRAQPGQMDSLRSLRVALADRLLALFGRDAADRIR